MIAPSDLLEEIIRCSTACARLELTPFERRELEGVLYALAWVAGNVSTPPVQWMLPHVALSRIDALVTGLMSEELPRDPVTAHFLTPPSTFIERSQPAGGEGSSA